MARASNFIPPADPPRGGRPGAVAGRRAARGEIAAAMGLVLGSPFGPADEAQVLDFMRYALRRGIDVTNVWVADYGGSIVWALLPVASPGRTALLLGPSTLPQGGGGAEAAGELVDAVCADFAARDLQLAQVLLEPADATSRRLYEGRGFGHVAQLIYLQAAPRRKAPPPPLPAGFHWLGYGPETHAHFAACIARTYQQSLDCPVLNGLRDMEDVLAGHKSSGEFDPRLWGMLCEGDDPRGVLLLSKMQPADSLELVYLGLTPEARGRGIGDLLMRQALATAAAEGASRLSLAVDSGNAPALKLYYRHGMQRVGAKEALMRHLRPSSAPDAKSPQR
jgi:mycothiol synthase